MKDGEKRAKKAAKTVKKASREKSSPKTAASKKGVGSKKAAAKIPVKRDGDNKGDATKGRKGPVVISFANPAVGNAFKRAVKKYSNALKRLTD